MGYSRLGICLLSIVQYIDVLTLHIRALKVYFFVDGVNNQLISPYDLGILDDVEVLEAPPIHPQTP